MTVERLTDRWPSRRRRTLVVTLSRPTTDAYRRTRDEATATALRAYLSLTTPAEHVVDLTI